MTQRARGWLSRPLRWFGKPLGKLARPLSKIEGIEKPAVYLGFAFVLWRLWVDQRAKNSALSGRGGSPGTRRRRPSLRLRVQELVAERWDRAAGRRAEEHDSRANP